MRLASASAKWWQNRFSVIFVLLWNDPRHRLVRSIFSIKNHLRMGQIAWRCENQSVKASFPYTPKWKIEHIRGWIGRSASAVACAPHKRYMLRKTKVLIHLLCLLFVCSMIYPINHYNWRFHSWFVRNDWANIEWITTTKVQNKIFLQFNRLQ